jgi:hypothetical protein
VGLLIGQAQIGRMMRGKIALRMNQQLEPPRAWSPAELEGCHASIVKLHDYWRSKCGDRAMPARRDIDPTDMRGLLPNVILVDVVDDARRYVYRLVGTHEVEMRGSDPTGKPVREAFYAESAEDTLRYLDRVVATARPVLYRGTYQPTSTRTQTEETLFLPLSNDGAKVNMILIYGHTSWVRDEERP